VNGDPVQRRAVLDLEKNPDKCKRLLKMVDHHAQGQQGRLKVVMIKSVQLIASGQIGQNLEVVPNHVVEDDNILNEK
jgi:hypothetical protein